MPAAASKKIAKEILILSALIVGISYFLIAFDVVDRWYAFTRAHEDWELDELTVIFISTVLAAAVTMMRHSRFLDKNYSEPPSFSSRTALSDERSLLKLPLTAFYVFGLSVIGIFLMLSYFLMSNAINNQKHDAHVINVSGRQRMLSQKAGLIVANMTYPEKRKDARRDLRETIDLMRLGHNGLIYGDERLDLPPLESDQLKALYLEDKQAYGRPDRQITMTLDERVNHYLDDLEQILLLEDSQLVMDNKLIAHVLKDYPHTLLPLLDRVVGQFETETAQRNVRLRNMERAMLFLILAVLITEGIFLFRPMVLLVRRQAEEIERKKDNEKLAALGELSGGLAHEINNALQPALGLSPIIVKSLREKGEETLADYVDVIESSALHARKIVQNVLIFAREQEKEEEIHLAGDLFKEAAAFSQSAMVSSVTVDFVLQGFNKNHPVFIRCDKDSVFQVFTNIIKNAAQAMNDKGTIHVLANLSPVGRNETGVSDLGQADSRKFIVIEVRDTGSGINEETLGQIFNPFFTTKDVGEGTGLGLSVAYGIMRHIGGAITAESIVGKGSCFRLYFPVFERESE